MKKQICACGCGETFTVNPLRKYFSNACRARVARRNNRVCKICGVSISHRGMNAKICEDIECYRATQREQRKKPPRTYGETKCAICGDTFTKNTPNHKHCCADCRKIARGIVQTPIKNRIAYVPQPGDWTHQDFLREQRELKKKNGRVCQKHGCDNKLTGNDRQRCPSCVASDNTRSDRMDGEFLFGGVISDSKYDWSLNAG